jgi:dTMP kinase
MEELKPQFYEAVREGYLTLAHEEPGRIRVIDAARTVEVVEEEVWTCVSGLLGK